jgi:hypothetical protein
MDRPERLTSNGGDLNGETANVRTDRNHVFSEDSLIFGWYVPRFQQRRFWFLAVVPNLNIIKIFMLNSVN